MANFEVKVYKIASVENHPNADRLSIVKLKGIDYTCIANKLEDGSPRYNVGELVAYIPEQSILPKWMLKKMGFWNEEKNQGTLNGSNYNRVKALRLRGIYSEGLLYPIYQDGGAPRWGFTIYDDDGNFVNCFETCEGIDISAILGITKYDPPIPQHMSGEVFSVGDIFYHYDIESIQLNPNVFQHGENIRVTEKIHGTQTRIHFTKEKYNESDECFELKTSYSNSLYVYVSSKGLGDQGLCFKDNEENSQNLYIKTFKENFKDHQLEIISSWFFGSEDPNDNISDITFFGETFGNVQDLKYGVKPHEPNKFNIFDIYCEKEFIDFESMKEFLNELKLSMVPILYHGEFSKEKIDELTSGKSTYNENQIREGIVITPTIERRDIYLGRVVLKSVSEDYKLRKGEVSEFN